MLRSTSRSSRPAPRQCDRWDSIRSAYQRNLHLLAYLENRYVARRDDIRRLAGGKDALQRWRDGASQQLPCGLPVCAKVKASRESGKEPDGSVPKLYVANIRIFEIVIVML
jgi:hypothetical protein